MKPPNKELQASVAAASSPVKPLWESSKEKNTLEENSLDPN